MVSVILAVTDLVCPKRYISDYTVKKAVRVTGFLKSLYCNPVLLVKLLCNLPGNRIKLYCGEKAQPQGDGAGYEGTDAAAL